MLADDFNLEDLGIISVGSFERDKNGQELVHGFTFDYQLGVKIPKFLANEPPLFLSDSADCAVYVRALYSEKLTNLRKSAFDNAGISRLEYFKNV